MTDDAWMPAPDDMLDWMVDIGFEGTELGTPGFLGDATQVHERLSSRGLEFVGSFLPQHFSRAEKAEEDRAWLRDSLRLVRESSPAGSQPYAILSDQFDEPDRRAFSGRIAEHPETWLSAARFDTLIDNLHRAAELCRAEGLEPVLHPHAGTYVETADEIARVMDRIDPSLIGLCLDTGHFRFGGADPAKAVGDYHELIRHVHVKDCRTSVMDDVKREGKGLERRSGAASSARSARATRGSTRSSRRSAPTTTPAGLSSSRTRPSGQPTPRNWSSRASVAIGSTCAASGSDPGRPGGPSPADRR